MHHQSAPDAGTMPKFPVGRLLITPNARDTIPPHEIPAALKRHVLGDWGDVDDQDRKANDRALLEGTRLFSVYHSSSGLKFWIITEEDRSATTILLPEDY